MNTPELVYKATDPAPSLAFLAECEAKWKAFRAEMQELGTQLGTTQLMMRRSGYGHAGGQYVTGYADQGNDPVQGFRRDAETGTMLPDLRTKAGKTWKERLEGTRYTPGAIPGLPEAIMGIGCIGGFVLVEHEGTVFASLGYEPRPESPDIERIDPKVWQPAKLSEFYTAVEAKEAQEKAA